MATNLTVSPVVKPWSLLDRLKTGLVVLIVADVIFLIVLLRAHGEYAGILKTITVDSEPSVIAAQQIKVEMAAMDADAANELLAKPGQATAALADYEKHRKEAAKALIAAANNITYPGEREPIESIQTNLGDYEARIQHALDLHEEGDKRAVIVYRQASDLMNAHLYLAADRLADVNRAELDKAFDLYTNGAAQTRAEVFAAGALLLGLLLFAQWDLVRRTRRLLNPGLLCASILTIALLSYCSTHLSKSASDLRVAKQDAFDSIHALWQARADAFAANADESKYLLPDNMQAAYEKSFFARADSTRDFLKKEMNNITFDKERDAADDASKDWEQYLKIDKKIRTLNTSGHAEDALALCLGTNYGQSDYEFEYFDKALMSTISVNQVEFDKARDSSKAQLQNLPEVASVGTAATAVFLVFGLLLRIREFL